MKKLFSLFSLVLMTMMFLNLNLISVSAEEPTTFYIKHNDTDDKWYYQIGSSWDDTQKGTESYCLLFDMKDGDYLVVAGSDAFNELNVDFHLGNLTMLPDTMCSITAKSIENCYALAGSGVSIFCNVTNAWVYDNAKVNFNKDCLNLELIYEDDPTMAVNLFGTCNYFHAHNKEDTKTMYKLWNFREDLIFSDGYLKTQREYYDIEPSAAPATPAPEVSTPTASTPSAPSASVDYSEYDEVPKTGEALGYMWAFGIAAVCFLGSFTLKKRA